MQTNLIITLPGKGVPALLIDEIDKALHAYYADTPLYQAWQHGPNPPYRIWATSIELVPESAEDETEAARIAGNQS